MVKFFIERPVFASSIAIIMVLAGLICWAILPVAQFPDITPPQIPGHEWAGVVAKVGSEVTRWSGGERVTAPFVCACGSCSSCARGDQQVCERQTQPGFTHGGAFAERLDRDRPLFPQAPLEGEQSHRAPARVRPRRE